MGPRGSMPARTVMRTSYREPGPTEPVGVVLFTWRPRGGSHGSDSYSYRWRIIR